MYRMDLRGRNAIVTGSSRGIGRGIALALAREGVNIVLNYLSNRDAAMRTARDIRELGVDAIIVQGDVSRYSDAENIFKRAVEAFDRIDILVNNAGIFKYIYFTDLTPDDWDRMMKVNLYGVFNMTRLVVPHMIENGGGVIVNISSIASSIRSSKALPHPGRVAYITSKSAVNGFTLALAMELAKYNIRVNAVAPGLTDTDLIRLLPNLDERVKEVPLGRIGEPSEIGDTVVFICKNDFLTGEIIVVAGGE